MSRHPTPAPLANHLCLMLCVIFAYGTSGCGSDEPTPEELLLRKQREREMAEINRPRTREERLAEGEREFELRNYDRVAAITRELLVAHPADAEVLVLSAKSQAAAGDKLAAAHTLGSIPINHPQLGKSAAMQAAKWLADVERFEDAINHLQAVLQVHPQSNRTRHQLAALLNNSGRRIEAARQLKVLARAGDISEKELFSMVTLSNPFIDISMKKPEFKNGLAPAALAQARVHHLDNDLPKAVRLAEQLNQAFPNSAPVSAFLGRLYAELRDEERLLKWLQQTPDGIQEEPEYWHALGTFFQQQNQHAHAIRCFAEAVKRDETDRFSYLGLARSLKLQGDEERGAEVTKRFELLAESARLARKFGGAPGTSKELERMAEILDQLQRPYESIAWRMIAARNANAADQIAKLKQRREAFKQSNPSLPAAWRSCGIDPSEFPLPDLADIQARGRDPGFARLPASQQPIKLEDVAGKVGLNFQYISGDDPGDDKYFLHQLTGGGVGVIDYDLDGWPDVYLTQSGGPPMDASGSEPNQLWRNLVGQSFVNVTAVSGTGDRGYGQGVAVADLNQDGFPDLVVANIGANIRYLNQGDGSFVRQTLSVSSQPDHWTTSIACGDLSGDHLPEIVATNYVDDPAAYRVSCATNNEDCNPSAFRPAPDQVLTIQPSGDVAPWQPNPDFQTNVAHGFGIILTDIDGRPGNDLFIANDTEPNQYWQRQASTDDQGTLIETALISGCATGLHGARQGCMGVAAGDFDHNGLIDFHVTNFEDQASDLYLQRSGGLFSNDTMSFGVGDPTVPLVGWGTHAVDFQRDGWLDLAVLNGHLVDRTHLGVAYKMRPQLFQGLGDRFQLVTPDRDSYWSKPALGRTLAVLDFNRDGKPDLLANHLDLPVALLENQAKTQNWIQLELVGSTSERDAVGARVRVTAGDNQWTSWVVGGDGLLCSNEPVVDFGLGSHESVSEIVVTWPTGTNQQFASLAANHRYLVVEGGQDLFQRD